MNKKVALVAFQEFDNLGAGYLASVLTEAGYEPEIIDFMLGKEEILKQLHKLKPLITGFSVVFQYHIDEFRELIDYLRKGRIKCHFTAGGYYASLRFEEIFRYIPWLDSVVRFDGEYTLLELTNCIFSETDWKNLSGIAFRNNGEIVSNLLRPLEIDLDKFPFPKRTPLEGYVLDKKFATLLAGRGCTNRCSFCNNREYNKQSSGPIKRIRRPEKVVEEMEFLYHKMGCSLFMFEDDDFPVKADKGSGWIEKFCFELEQKKLNNKIMWKINCRPDEVDVDSFETMRNHGLFMLFLGIDDGSDIGLARLNKNMTVSKSLKGINILKKLGIEFDYGFMLFQPSSTFKILYENLDFLGLVCSDGYTPVTFLKLRPYFETQVEKELRTEGRLKGVPGYWDYDFIEGSMNNYYEFTSDCFREWLTYPEGLVSLLKWARNYISVISFYYKTTPEISDISYSIRQNISGSNLFFLDTMRELGELFEGGIYNNDNQGELNSYKEKINSIHNHITEETKASIRRMLLLVEYQKIDQLISK